MIRSSPGLNYLLTDQPTGPDLPVGKTATQAIVVARGMGRCEGDEG